MASLYLNDYIKELKICGLYEDFEYLLFNMDFSQINKDNKLLSKQNNLKDAFPTTVSFIDYAIENIGHTSKIVSFYEHPMDYYHNCIIEMTYFLAYCNLASNLDNIVTTFISKTVPGNAIKFFDVLDNGCLQFDYVFDNPYRHLRIVLGATAIGGNFGHNKVAINEIFNEKNVLETIFKVPLEIRFYYTANYTGNFTNFSDTPLVKAKDISLNTLNKSLLEQLLYTIL